MLQLGMHNGGDSAVSGGPNAGQAHSSGTIRLPNIRLSTPG
jgi:hypothetical protein